MPIVANFAIRQELAAGTTIPADLLGSLRGFIGPRIGRADQPQQRSWKGTGFNMIWRPNFNGQFGPQDFFLELNLTNETLEFLDITGSTGIANRGLLQKDVHLGCLGYLQTIFDRFDNSAQHFEPGVWANVDKTDNPDEPPTVVRIGSIPHGTTINMQGSSLSLEAQHPQFETASITPFKIGSRDDGKTNLQPFPDEEDLTKPSPSRTDNSHVQGLRPDQLTNPNLFLSEAIANQTMISTTVLVITSDTSAPNSIPQSGGGSDNIAFLTGSRIPVGAPNARVSRVTATFWIERVRDQGGNEFDQLQYTQRVLLDFNNLSWPHITVATLRGENPTLIGSNP
jgi:hypothetical protein